MRTIERIEAKIARLHAVADAHSVESGRLRVLSDRELEKAAELRSRAKELRAALNREQVKAS
jgi:hypothetical protein